MERVIDDPFSAQNSFRYSTWMKEELAISDACLTTNQGPVSR
jgi:hypothetical protein